MQLIRDISKNGPKIEPHGTPNFDPSIISRNGDKNTYAHSILHSEKMYRLRKFLKCKQMILQNCVLGKNAIYQHGRANRLQLGFITENKNDNSRQIMS